MVWDENNQLDCNCFYVFYLYQKRGNGLDMNVMSAWEQGVTGRRVVVTILDDGIEKDHPDLEDNYVRTERERERESLYWTVAWGKEGPPRCP